MLENKIDQAKWAKLTVFEQMGNIGSEVGRALSAKRRGDEDRATGAFYRGLDLLDATAQAWGQISEARTREILRAREQFVTAMTTDRPDPKLEDYFMHFAVAARRSHQASMKGLTA